MGARASSFNKSPFSGAGDSIEKRLFCFGCDEERHGKYVTRNIKLDGIEKIYKENICEGCAKVLDIIRPFLIPIVQIESHEGRVWWRIPRKTYDEHSNMLLSFREYNFPYEKEEDEHTIILGATDTGYGDKYSLDTLIDKLAIIRVNIILKR